MSASRRAAVGAVIVVLAGAVVLAHGAAADDHMGQAMAACIAVLDAAALGTLVLSAGRAPQRGWFAGIFGDWVPLQRPAAARASMPPWPRGSPFALQVLRL